eukprot:1168664-Prymnesium_polylepis.1
MKRRHGAPARGSPAAGELGWRTADIGHFGTGIGLATNSVFAHQWTMPIRNRESYHVKIGFTIVNTALKPYEASARSRL